MAPLSTPSTSSLAPMIALCRNGTNLLISTSSLNGKLSTLDDCKVTQADQQFRASESSSGILLPADTNAMAHDADAKHASAPTKKLFLSRKRRMHQDDTSAATFEESKFVKLEQNATPQHSVEPAITVSLQQATAKQPLNVNDYLTAGAVASDLCSIKRKANTVSESKRIVTPEVRSQCSLPTIRPLETDFCFGPGTSRNPGNKALKHIAYYTSLPFLQENSRSIPNENIIIAKRVIEAWTSAGGRFLKSDTRSALWLPEQDDDFILSKIQRSIGSWKGAWRQELQE